MFSQEYGFVLISGGVWMSSELFCVLVDARAINTAMLCSVKRQREKGRTVNKRIKVTPLP
jgi:hypothetical protein